MSRRSSDRHDRLFRVVLTVLLLSGAIVALAIVMQDRMEGERRYLLADITPAPAVTAAPTDAPTQTPGPTQTPDGDAEAPAQPTAPAGEDLLTAEAVTLPVFSKADTREHVVAITLDSVSSARYIKMAMELTNQFGTRFTLFPTGSYITASETSALLGTCVTELGYEVENRTWSNEKLYEKETIDMAKDIWGTQVALEYALGMKYPMHLIRTNGGENADDPRTCAYLKKLGYDGFVTWSVIGSTMTTEELEKSLSPGQIYMFSCSEDNMMQLAAFLRYIEERHYEVLTVSELLGYGTVQPTPYDGDILAQLMPYPDDFALADTDFTSGMRAWQVLLIQRRLAELGYLAPRNADGVFGDSTTHALIAFQSNNGQAATGIASHETQNLLFSEDVKEADVRVTDAPTPSPTPFGYMTPVPTVENQTLPPDSVAVPDGAEAEGDANEGAEDELIFSAGN